MTAARPVREVLAEMLDARGRSSQADLAKKLGVDPDMVSRWVGRGKTKTALKADDVALIARALGVRVCDLYGVDEQHDTLDLTPAEREALDNVARELVKLRGQKTTDARPGRPQTDDRPAPGLRYLRAYLRQYREDEPTMSAAERQELREFAAAILAEEE